MGLTEKARVKQKPDGNEGVWLVGMLERHVPERCRMINGLNLPRTKRFQYKKPKT